MTLMNLRDVKLRMRALIARRRVERELDEELAFHIARETEKLVASGMSRPDARAAARARFGPASIAAEECRDARGTALIDDGMRDVRYALRSFRRAPLFAVTVVTTVALSVGLIAVAFSFFNTMFFRVDEVQRPHELYAVELPVRPGVDAWVDFTRPDYEALRRETRIFADVFGRFTDADIRIDGRMTNVHLVTGNFFHVLGVNAALGRTLVPADDERVAPRPVLVLSHRHWQRQFAGDPAAVGRRLLINGAQFEIVGVMPDGFRGLELGPPDYWAPLSLLGQFRRMHAGNEDTVGIGVIGRLKPAVSRQAAIAQLGAWAAGREYSRPSDRAAAANITLEPRQGTVNDSLAEGLLVFSPIFFAFGLVLMIGCTNVANLLLARGVARQREIGVRLALGASRRRVIRQLLTESLLLALVAAPLGLLVSRVVLEIALSVVRSTMPAEIAEAVSVGSVPAADWRVIAFILVSAIASTILFGLAPALQATRIEVVRTMRGEIGGDARPGRARDVLIGAQVTASALLLICAAVFLRSATSAARFDPGIRTADTVSIDINNEPFRVAMIQAVIADPTVAAVSASWPDIHSAPQNAFGNKEGISYRFVSPEYFDVLGIPILRGRVFSNAESGAAVAVVSETAARRLWPGRNAVGQELQLEPPIEHGRASAAPEPPLASRTLIVVGVARDVPDARFGFLRPIDVYVPTTSAQARTSLIVRVHGDPHVARGALLERLTKIDPNMGGIMTLRTLASVGTYVLQIAFWVTVVIGGLALALTVSGLFSMLSYVIEQRAKEISVRMALGATAGSVAVLVLSQLARPVALGLVVGGSLAAALAAILMATPAATEIGSIVRLFDPLAYAGGVLTIIAACALAASIPALRAARIDPMRTLRQE